MFLSKIQTLTGIENLPATGGYIIAANHIDWLDGFFIAAAVGKARNIPVHFLTSSNNYWWTTMAIQIPPSRRGDIVGQAAQALRDGKVICNFIEGQRNMTDTMLPGKTGTVRIALAAGVPIIPLGIECRGWKSMSQSVQKLMLGNDLVQIHIGKAMHFEQVAANDIQAATDQVTLAIAKLANKK